jgi:5'-3' exonuclease
MKLLLKRDNTIPDIYAPLGMAVLGDPGDDIDGIKGVGPAGFLEIFDQLVALTGTMKDIYKNLQNNQDLFKTVPANIVNKKLEKVVDQETKTKVLSKAIKLISFELLSRELDDPSTTEMLDKRKLIEQRMSEKEVVPLESMKTALIKNGVYLEESSIDFLYI